MPGNRHPQPPLTPAELFGEPEPPPVPRLALTAAEMALALGISQRHLAELTREEGFPHVKLRRRIVYPIGLARRYLTENAVRNNGAVPTEEGGEDKKFAGQYDRPAF